MSFLFRRSEKARRSSDDDYKKMQYHTERGPIPARVVEQQMHECESRLGNKDIKKYPHWYQNREGVFQPHEQRNNDTKLYESPVSSRIDLDRKTCSHVKAMNRLNPPPNDRARVAQSEANDPGVFRGVIAADKNTGHVYGVAGVIYHPEGDVRAMRRAPVEPLDREGRQFLRRFDDDAADPHRVTTWPPRDEDGSDLAMYESRYVQERTPRPPQQPKTSQKKAKKGFFSS
ncbi:hypothetical protein NW768_002885 [Fusarium equiseti]|uniref:Uncharacterized protein n=1 Tax=Fusarium equiseti TaxID=61235 RepID=A0ABQ8RKJ8_FUSEQ|nr:hypothetical protein NW768_002885 [Fusarium equiseti]